MKKKITLSTIVSLLFFTVTNTAIAEENTKPLLVPDDPDSPCNQLYKVTSRDDLLKQLYETAFKDDCAYQLPREQLAELMDAEQTISPIVIDLDGNGIATINKSYGVHFDLDNSGFAELTGWINADDGLLVMDRNGNGKIDNGGELFGNYTVLNSGEKAANGFVALAELDSNADGQIDSNDTAWSNLRIWQDANQNGISEQGELKTLDSFGIASLSIDAERIKVRDSSGNDHLQTATVTWDNNNSGIAEDIWFQVDTARTVNRNPVAVSADIKALPQVWGFGNVADLRTAMATDSVLKNKVTAYIAADAETRTQLLDDLIYRWTGSEDVDPNSRDSTSSYGHVMDARQLVTLEHLVGRGYLGTWSSGKRDPNPHGRAAPKLIAEYQKFANYVAATIADQADFGGLLANLPKSYNNNIHSYTYNWQAFDEKVIDLYQQQNGEAAIKELLSISKNYGTYLEGFSDILENHLVKLAGRVDPPLAALLADANRFFIGTDDSNKLKGNDKNNVLEGLKGDDTLMGGDGDDSYRFSVGDGADTIYDSSGIDSIIFTESAITPDSIHLTRDLTSVMLTRYNSDGTPSSDSIKIDNFYDFNGAVAEGNIETIRFADGTVWNADYIEQKLRPTPTENDDILYLDESNNTINGLSEDDAVYGGDGNDEIHGNSGNDVLYGDNGNDTLRKLQVAQYVHENNEEVCPSNFCCKCKPCTRK